jgi:hypothetical protein
LRKGAGQERKKRTEKRKKRKEKKEKKKIAPLVTTEIN